MRRRIYRLFNSLGGYNSSLISAGDLEFELGVEVPRGGISHLWDRFFESCSLHDLLDTITIIASHKDVAQSSRQGQWVRGVSKIFEEEHVHYRLDTRGGVHFAIDGEFAFNQACALKALESPRYRAARSHFEAGQQALDASPPRTRDAIRQTFECVETIFKLMFSDVSQLGASEVMKKLRPIIDRNFKGSEKDTASQLLEGFKSWINSAHPYRHGQGVEVPDNASLDTAVLSVSLGATYARWLLSLELI